MWVCISSLETFTSNKIKMKRNNPVLDFPSFELEKKQKLDQEEAAKLEELDLAEPVQLGDFDLLFQQAIQRLDEQRLDQGESVKLEKLDFAEPVPLGDFNQLFKQAFQLLDEYTLCILVSFLSRVDLQRLCQTTKFWKQLFSPFCELMLTEFQNLAVETILKRFYDPESEFVKHLRAHNSISGKWGGVIASGPGTGKTLMAYKAAGVMLQKQPERAILFIVDARLIPQWKLQYEQCRRVWRELDLPELCVFECSNHRNDAQLERSGIVMVAKSKLGRFKYIRARDSDYKITPSVLIGDRVMEKRFQAIFVDEASYISHFVDTYVNVHWKKEQTEQARRPVVPFNLNASKAGARKKNCLVNYVHDTELQNPAFNLEALPRVILEISTMPELFKDVRSSTKVSSTIVQYIERHRQGKTLVLYDNFYDRKTTYNPCYDVGGAHVDGAVHLSKCHTANEKAQRLTEFLTTTKDMILTSTISYLKRGFNIQCDTLLVLMDNGNSYSIASLQQLLGRVRRVGPKRLVRVKFFITRRLQMSHFGFAVQALDPSCQHLLGNTYTMDVLWDNHLYPFHTVHWNGKNQNLREFISQYNLPFGRVENGKYILRKDVPYLKKYFSRLWPQSEKYIKYMDENVIIVSDVD